MPHNTSDLENDSGFVDKNAVIEIVDSRSKCGYYSVETYNDMVNIPEEILVNGCMCYVVNEDNEYRYTKASKQWVENSIWEEL